MTHFVNSVIPSCPQLATFRALESRFGWVHMHIALNPSKRKQTRISTWRGVLYFEVMLQLRVSDLSVINIRPLRCSDLANCGIPGDEVANSLPPSRVEHHGQLVELPLGSANACQHIFQVLRPERAISPQKSQQANRREFKPADKIRCTMQQLRAS